ncbi:hypothetical protein DCAR_0101176 [Daucus carota subsp. sativus]|uniref:GRF-type domain-containing protein n=1 Tax=Daucus carota subsp. sativus TaxID=79200 RepID=A0A166G6R3_DAUCS|nr:PREDICTED: uncharacterized protein At4g04775-like [Daucus carota subsp. sativus]WOG82017.1 hypothetical protein DCAR_0101176 [Daucus carota subsp. sativus]
MTSQEGGSSSASMNPEQKYCMCGKRARMNTSWTYNNPGRRFFTCARPKEATGCHFFEWVDDDFSGRAMAVITHLNHRRLYLEEKLKLVEENLSENDEKRKILQCQVEELTEGRIVMQAENQMLKKQMYFCVCVVVAMVALVLMLK